MIEHFGNLPDGGAVKRIRITNGDLTANILTLGATLQSLYLDGHDPSLVLGFDNLAGYLQYPFFGPLVGRVANRISNAGFELEGRQYQTDNSWLGRHSLHGGAGGIHRLNWDVAEVSQTSVKLETTDREAVSGFPGDCKITATFTVNGNALELDIRAQTQCTSVCNIAHHSYFNLDGTADTSAHTLTLDADTFLPVDEDLIPTGVVAPVEGTFFDFQKGRLIDLGHHRQLDHNFCLAEARRPLAPIGHLSSAASGISMMIATTEPGIQVYSAAQMNSGIPGTGGRAHGPFGGIALEPQGWPDAPNRPEFPSIVLGPDETYHQRTAFTFLKG